MFRTILPVSLVAMLATGCGSDCADASRMNGTYAMWHAVTNMGEGGAATVSENYPSYLVFVNGWSKWKIKASTSSGSLNTDITDVADEQGDYNETSPVTQPFSGKLTASEDNCNAVNLHIEGEFDTTASTAHAFVYDADLVFSGEHISGTFTYSDTFTGTDAEGNDISGALDQAAGEISGTLQLDDFDTDFAE